jgi:uncharacterized protein
MPTANCPHGCNKPEFGAYCGQIHEGRTLGSTHIEATLREIEAELDNRKYSTLKLGFFGGEPLLVPRIVLFLLERAKELCELRNVRLLATLSSSGLLLTPDLAIQLREAGLDSIEITLDGTQHYHDSRRCTKSGNPTFNTIYNHLTVIANSARLCDLGVTVRMNVDSRNANGALPLFEQLCADKLWPRVRFYLAPVHDWGQAKAGSDHFDSSTFAKLELDLLRLQIRLGVNPGLLPARKTITCVALDEHAQVIDPFGHHFKCTELPLTGQTRGLRMPEEEKWGKVFSAKVEHGEVPCSTCALLPVCGGACPKEWFEGGSPCPSLKYNLRERMILAFHSLGSRTVDAVTQ